MSRHESRQKLAREFGATDIVTERGDEGVARIKELTGGLGAHSVIEAVGTQESMMQAIRSTRPGGHVGYVGVAHDVAAARRGAVLLRRAPARRPGPGPPVPARADRPDLDAADRPRQGLRPRRCRWTRRPRATAPWTSAAPSRPSSPSDRSAAHVPIPPRRRKASLPVWLQWGSTSTPLVRQLRRPARSLTWLTNGTTTTLLHGLPPHLLLLAEHDTLRSSGAACGDASHRGPAAGEHHDPHRERTDAMTARQAGDSVFDGGRWHGHWIAADLPQFAVDPTSLGGDLPPAGSPGCSSGGRSTSRSSLLPRTGSPCASRRTRATSCGSTAWRSVAGRSGRSRAGCVTTSTTSPACCARAPTSSRHW